MTAPASVAAATPARSGTTMPFTRWSCTQAGAVAAEAEEGAVTERDEPRVAHQEVVGDGEQREDHDLRPERDRGPDRAP